MTEKQLVPKHVADWVKFCKGEGFKLIEVMSPHVSAMQEFIEDFEGNLLEALDWIGDNQEEFAKAWFIGYEAEKHAKYTVCIQGVNNTYKFLKYNNADSYWYFSNGTSGEYFTPYHTKEELEKAGFGWVFSCEGVSIVEVK